MNRYTQREFLKCLKTLFPLKHLLLIHHVRTARLACVLALAFGFACPTARSAENNPVPFALNNSYSAELIVTQGDGTTTKSRIFVDGRKIRVEPQASGSASISIIRPDQKKLYSVMNAQKTVVESPFEDGKAPKILPTISGTGAKFELIGPDSVEGVDCTKYKMTGPDKSISSIWINTAKLIPVKMVSEDGSYTVEWKNYQAGLQDPALFEPPADYKMMNMPSTP